MNKIVLVTGASRGIGLEVAKLFSKEGYKVIGTSRGDFNLGDLIGDSSAMSVQLDLMSKESINDLFEVLKSKDILPSVLINNAGIFPPKQRFTLDGFEMQFGVNHLSHFLLTNLLMDCLEKTAPSRVITVSSMLHKKGEIAFDSFRGYEKYNSSVAYNNSKLCNVLFALELASRKLGSGVTSNVLHPGAVSTDIVRDLPWVVRKIIGMMSVSYTHLRAHET